MNSDAAPRQNQDAEICVYECEVYLKFRLVEEKRAFFGDRHRLLELLTEAYTAGADEYMQPIEEHVEALEISELDAPVEMRRLLMRLRNSSELA